MSENQSQRRIWYNAYAAWAAEMRHELSPEWFQQWDVDINYSRMTDSAGTKDEIYADAIRKMFLDTFQLYNATYLSSPSGIETRLNLHRDIGVNHEKGFISIQSSPEQKKFTLNKMYRELDYLVIRIKGMEETIGNRMSWSEYVVFIVKRIKQLAKSSQAPNEARTATASSQGDEARV